MKKQEQLESGKHVDELLLPYLEGLLPPEKRSTVQKHLQDCPQCSAELADLKQTIGDFRQLQGVLCPEPWELYEFVNYGQDTGGTVSRHLAECSVCRDFARSFSVEEQTETMPEELWLKLKERIPKPQITDVDTDRESFGLWAGLKLWRGVPALAAGVAAAILLLILLIPREVPRQVVALSPVAWANVPKPKTLPVSHNRAAIIIALEDFPKPLQQTKIDALYRAVAPSMELYERFWILPPNVVKDAVENGLVKTTNTREILRGLRKEFDISVVALATIIARPKAMEIQVKLIDAGSGKTLVTRRMSGVRKDESGPKIGEEVSAILRDYAGPR